jgi:hypothetical protein
MKKILINEDFKIYLNEKLLKKYKNFIKFFFMFNKYILLTIKLYLIIYIYYY